MDESKLSAIKPPNLPESSSTASVDCHENEENRAGSHKSDDLDTVGIAQAKVDDDRHRRTEEFLKDTQQDRTQRKDYANKIFWLVVGWLFVLTMIVLGTGRGFLNLKDSVLVTLITGASVNIIGLMAIVANYLFPKTKRNHKDYHSD